MSMTVVVTRNVSQRVRGFMASAMLEVGPGVYVAARISPAVRDRVWAVLSEWFPNENASSLVMVWRETSAPCGLAVRTLGAPPVEMVEVDGIILARRMLAGA